MGEAKASLMDISQQDVLDELQGLDTSRWLEVRDFILFLKQRVVEETKATHERPWTGQDLCELAALGLWVGREDIGDSPSYARELRRRSGRRFEGRDAAA